MTPSERADAIMCRLYGQPTARDVQWEFVAAAIREAMLDCARIVDAEHEDPGEGPDAALTRAAAAIREEAKR